MDGVTTIGEDRWYAVPKQWDPAGTRKPWPSATTVIGIVDKPHLRPWYAKKAAQRMAADHERMAGLIAAGKAEKAVELAAAEPNRIRDAAGDLGKLVHRVIEWEVLGRAYTLTEDEQTLVDPYLDTIRQFVRDMDLRIFAAETAVYDQYQEYAGTVDLYAAASVPVPVFGPTGELLDVVPPGTPGVWDWKTGTGSGIKSSGVLQVTAYATATHWDLKDGTGELLRKPQASWGALVHLDPPRYRVYGVPVTPAAVNAFRLARQLFRVVRESPPAVIGVPVTAGKVHLDDLKFIRRAARAQLTIDGVFDLADAAALGRDGFTAYDDIGKVTADKVGRFLHALGLEWAEPKKREKEKGAA